MADFSGIKTGDDLDVNQLISDMKDIAEGVYGFSAGPAQAVTISGGVIDITSYPDKSLFTVDTEAAAATDDLDTITDSSPDGKIIILKGFDNTRDVTVKDGTGNIQIAGDFTFSHNRDAIVLQKVTSGWFERGRADIN